MVLEREVGRRRGQWRRWLARRGGAEEENSLAAALLAIFSCRFGFARNRVAGIYEGQLSVANKFWDLSLTFATPYKI